MLGADLRNIAFCLRKYKMIADTKRHAGRAVLWENRANLWPNSAQTIGPELAIFFNDQKQSAHGYALSDRRNVGERIFFRGAHVFLR